MRLFPFMVALLFMATPVMAGSITYEFEGTFDGGSDFNVSLTLDYDTLPDDANSSGYLGTYTEDILPSFLDWEFTVDGVTHSPSGTFRSDEIYVLNDDTDQVLIFSSYDENSVQFLFEDGNVLDNDSVPNLIQDWTTMTFSAEWYESGQLTRGSGAMSGVAVVPLPAAAWMGFVLLGGLAIRRARKKR